MTTGAILQVRTSIKGRELETLRFSEREVSIGRDAACGIVFDNAGVSRLHAVLSCGPNGEVQVSDRQSSNGTYVNGRRVDSSVLRPGDKVEIGKFTLEVSLLPGAVAGQAPEAHGEDDFLAARPASSPNTVDGTVVLGAQQRQRILAEAPASTAPPTAPATGTVRGSRLPVLMAFAAGLLVGAMAVFLLLG